jgi:cell division protein FtsZ
MAIQEINPEFIPGARIKVIGVGGAGCNTINRMIQEGLEGVEFIAVNTDAQALENNLASTKTNIGLNLTRGLGAGANPEVGRKAAEENLDEIKRHLEDTDMVFITAGM